MVMSEAAGDTRAGPRPDSPHTSIPARGGNPPLPKHNPGSAAGDSAAAQLPHISYWGGVAIRRDEAKVAQNKEGRLKGTVSSLKMFNSK